MKRTDFDIRVILSGSSGSDKTIELSGKAPLVLIVVEVHIRRVCVAFSSLRGQDISL